MGAVISSLFGIAEHTLGIYKSKEARKYLDRVLYLKKRYYEEENKKESLQNHALMDNIVHELCLISDSIASFKESISKD